MERFGAYQWVKSSSLWKRVQAFVQEKSGTAWMGMRTKRGQS